MTRSPYDQTPTFYPEPWEDKAACLDKDPERWFSDNPFVIEGARIVCAECPVRLQCLEKGMTESHGMFGGLTPKERKAANVNKTPEAVETRKATIARLHAEGHNDYVIADMLGMGASNVQRFRTELGLPPVRTHRAS